MAFQRKFDPAAVAAQGRRSARSTRTALAVDQASKGQSGRVNKRVLAAHYPVETISEINEFLALVNIHLLRSGSPKITLQDLILAGVNEIRKKGNLLPLRPDGYNVRFVDRLRGIKTLHDALG